MKITGFSVFCYTKGNILQFRKIYSSVALKHYNHIKYLLSVRPSKITLQKFRCW